MSLCGSLQAPLAGICLALTLAGCNKDGSNMIEHWSGGLITQPGTYKMAGGSNEIIVVLIDHENVVRYSITDSNGKLLHASTQHPSAYHKWFLYFDERGWLWFSSGDIGSFVARKNTSWAYEELSIADHSALIRDIPAAFFMRLPESTQRKWAQYRERGS
jgi:hypothetical protein